MDLQLPPRFGSVSCTKFRPINSGDDSETDSAVENNDEINFEKTLQLKSN